MLVSLTEITALAEQTKTAVGAFNTPNLECINAVLAAAEKLNVPVILAHAQLHETVSPLSVIGPVMVLAAKNARVPVCVHLDHCETLEYMHKALEIGFTGVMYDGSLLPYDSLCVAAGSSPFVPPFAGLDTVEKKFSFMTLDDALALEAAVKPDSRVLIVGAGLIGLKCAEGLRDRVASITVCDLAERVLSSILDTDCAAVMQKHLEKNGISFLLGDSAAEFSGNTARMKSGRTVEFDVLVLAVGVRANTALVKDIGGEVNRGIVVNQRMETSVPNVYSAGDCTEGEDISFGGRRVLAILPNAYMQGKCAGVNMAGGTEVFDKAIPMNSIKLHKPISKAIRKFHLSRTNLSG